MPYRTFALRTISVAFVLVPNGNRIAGFAPKVVVSQSTGDDKGLMRLQSPRPLLVRMSILLIVALTLGLQTASADSTPVTLHISAGGSGSGGGVSGIFGVGEQMIGTFEFNTTTMTVFDVQLDGTETWRGTDSGTLTEYWNFGPVAGSVSGPYEIFSWAGYVGSLGDLLEFAVVLMPEGWIVEPTTGPMLGSSTTSPQLALNSLDNWGGTITPVPEPTSFSLFGTAFLLMLARAATRPAPLR